MAQRPSAPLLALLRKVARERGLNTAALAQQLKVPRAQLKHILAGNEDLTVDQFIRLAEILELDAGTLASLPEDGDAPAAEDDDQGPMVSRGGAALATVDRRSGPPPEVIDPYGNHAEQALRLGFALGVDMHVLLDTALLEGSGVPLVVRKQYEERLPVRFDAPYHRHHDPRFLPEGLSVKLSFDALYDCHLPWAAFLQITLIPLPPELPEPEPEEEEPQDTGVRRGHLRLVT